MVEDKQTPDEGSKKRSTRTKPPSSKNIIFRAPEDVHAKLFAYATSKQQTITQVLIDLIKTLPEPS